MRSIARRAGLGPVAEAVLLAGVCLTALGTSLRAQPTRPVPVRPDTTRDSLRTVVPLPAVPRDTSKIDSIRGIPDTLKTPTRRDSIQAPLVHCQLPTSIDVRPAYHWTRDSVFTTGAVTVADLLERIPGVAVYRSGFLASAQTATYLGEYTRIRVFRDGIEVDPIDSRSGGIADLADLQLGNLDDVTIERSAGELRVHMRTWTVRNTTAYTRVDAQTGDEDTNLYRFFFGRRFGSGFAAQLGVQQFGTGARNRRVGGGGSVLDALGRFGWSRGKWGADATYQRLDRERDLTTAFSTQDSLLPVFKGRRTEAVYRVGYGEADSSGLWLQALVSNASLRLTGTSLTRFDSTRIPNDKFAIDTVLLPDSSEARRQYVLSGGYTLGPARFSVTERRRTVRGATLNSPSARVDFANRFVSLTAFGELKGIGGDKVGGVPTVRFSTVDSAYHRDTVGFALSPDRTTRLDLSARVTPLPWLAVIGSVSRETRTSYLTRLDSTRTAGKTTAFAVGLADTNGIGRTTSQIEAAVRFHRLWLGAGRVMRSSSYVQPPAIYEQLRLGAVEDPSAAATIVSARGGVWKDVYTDLQATVWDSVGPYRSRLIGRGEVGVQSEWLRRFPTGNFGFKFAIIDNYRSATPFPGVIITDDSTLALRAGASNTVDVQLEIRILSGTLNYQLRNALNRTYELVPGFRMPGAINFYGLRWAFWN